MLEITLPKDLKDVEDFQLLPPGVYDFEVASVEQRSGGAGPYLNWICKCIENGFSGQVFHTTSLTEQSLWNLKGFVRALGWKEPIGRKFDAHKFVGRKFKGEVIQEPYADSKTGQMKKAVRLIDTFPIGTGMEDPAKPTEAKADAKPSKSQPAAQSADEISFD